MTLAALRAVAETLVRDAVAGEAMGTGDLHGGSGDSLRDGGGDLRRHPHRAAFLTSGAGASTPEYTLHGTRPVARDQSVRRIDSL